MATIWRRSISITSPWPALAVVDGKGDPGRYREGFDPYVKAGRVRFYGKPDGKAVIFALPYEPAAEAPDKEYDMGSPPVACWSTGTPAP